MALKRDSQGGRYRSLETPAGTVSQKQSTTCFHRIRSSRLKLRGGRFPSSVRKLPSNKNSLTLEPIPIFPGGLLGRGLCQGCFDWSPAPGRVGLHNFNSLIRLEHQKCDRPFRQQIRGKSRVTAFGPQKQLWFDGTHLAFRPSKRRGPKCFSPKTFQACCGGFTTRG